MAANWVSVVPLLVVIMVSLWTKQVLIGLSVGVILGAWLITPGIMPTLDTLLTYLYQELLIPGNLHLLVFLYLFGAFSPVTGHHFLLGMPHCNSDTFQVFLKNL